MGLTMAILTNWSAVTDPAVIAGIKKAWAHDSMPQGAIIVYKKDDLEYVPTKQ